MPEDESPMTFLAQGAAAQHEVFMAYIEAGFRRDEALQIIIAMVTEAFRRGADQGDQQ